jgi:hypothetical protein
VYVYMGSSVGLSDAPAVTWIGLPNELYGESLATGDINADGYPDLLAGAVSAGGNKGAGLVGYGSPAGLPASPDLSVPGIDADGALVDRPDDGIDQDCDGVDAHTGDDTGMPVDSGGDDTAPEGGGHDEPDEPAPSGCGCAQGEAVPGVVWTGIALLVTRRRS